MINHFNVNDMNNTNATKGVLRPVLLRIHNSEQQPIFEKLNNSTAVFGERPGPNQDLSPYHLNLNSKKGF
ncbi:ATV_HP_G0014930.mRNA.1.CDS.1 [Saccharomyces cerevisiae]|nr:ATV_HP_G0014930.mRNA.1.CDS.1 [Saccharomyces cerevisiae]CAI6949888.1 ATV_HP_G0014930.mRNA.1.CDS.1 [Saccharomyces cerevisiae]